MSLLLLFSGGGEEPIVDLPDLYVRDAKSGLNVPVAGVFGWDEDFLQAQTLCYAPMSFLDQETLVENTLTAMNWCRRLSKALISLEFSASGANCVLYPVYLDQNDVPILGKAITITASSQTMGGSNYVAPMEIVDTYGARRIQFLPDSISSGNVYMRVTGV